MTIKAYVVLNPVAGQSDPQEIRALLKDAMDKGLWDFDLYETTGKEDLKQIVTEALRKDYDLIVACGGDGTVSGVADGVAGSDVLLGVLPGGTVNAFATEMDMPKTIEDSMDVILGEHEIRKIDAIKSGGHFYLLFASVGFSSTSIDAVDREEKDKLGWLAYLSNAIQKSFESEPFYVKIEVDGKAEEFEVHEVLLFNSDQIGVVDEHIGLDVKIDDNLLDLYAVRSGNFGDMIQSLFNRVSGKSEKAPYIRHWSVEESVRIETDPIVAYQADGDIKGETPVVFEVAKGVLSVVANRGND
jgi:YegS/Rv2252/BmrU family lipid kinase